MIFDLPEVSDLRVSFWSVLVPAVAGVAAFARARASFGVGRSMRRGRRPGVGEMIGLVGRARDRARAGGHASSCAASTGRRVADQPIAAGERVEIVGRRGPAPAGAAGAAGALGCASDLGGGGDDDLSAPGHRGRRASRRCCFAGLRVLQEYERGVVFRLGRYAGVKQAGLTWIIPGVDRHGEDQPARDRDGRAVAGGDHARQRLGEGQRGALLPRAAPREGGDLGRELPVRHLAARADHAAQRVRPGRARRAARRARADQPPAPGDHRPAHRGVGRQGARGRGEADRPARGDAARDGQAGRGRAREARQADPRRGRVQRRRSG